MSGGLLILRSRACAASRRMAAAKSSSPSFETLASQAPQDEVRIHSQVLRSGHLAASRIQISNSERICVRVLAAWIAPEVCISFTLLRKTEGAGKAGCQLHPRSCAQKAHEWTTGSTGSLRLSLREWFTAYSVLSPVTGLFATVASRIDDASPIRLGRMHLRKT